MAKGINWPLPFRDEVIGENTEDLRIALRLGRLYFDNQYWVDGDVVDIRVDHRLVRKATIVGEMKCCPIQALTPADYAAEKGPLKTLDSVVSFLASTYSQAVGPETEVTAVYYRNHALDPEIMDVQDDPHMG